MKKNIGKADRTARIVAALLIAAFCFGKVITGTAAIILLIIAGILILTSFINFCPLYWALGISTRKKSINQQS